MRSQLERVVGPPACAGASTRAVGGARRDLLNLVGPVACAGASTRDVGGTRRNMLNRRWSSTLQHVQRLIVQRRRAG